MKPYAAYLAFAGTLMPEAMATDRLAGVLSCSCISNAYTACQVVGSTPQLAVLRSLILQLGQLGAGAHDQMDTPCKIHYVEPAAQ